MSIDIFTFIRSLNYDGYYIDLRTMKVCPVEAFDVFRDQEITNLKTKEYINNFIFVPKLRSQIIIQRIYEAFKTKELGNKIKRI